MSLLLKIHLGLGDALICNGLVRTLIREHDWIDLPCLARYGASIQWMFRDEPRIRVLPKASVAEIAALQAKDMLGLGHWSTGTGRYESDGSWARGRQLHFDQGFYAQAGVPFEAKWSAFKVSRDKTIELPVPAQPCRFAHAHGGGLKIAGAIEPTEEWANFFVWWGIVEAAAEVHCTDSSFMNFADLIETAGQLFLHKAFVEKKRWRQAVLRKPWQIVGEPFDPPCGTDY